MTSSEKDRGVTLVRKSLTNKQWDRIKGKLPGRVGDPGRSARDNRLFVEAVLWIARTGTPWRDLPRKFGKWYTAYTRYRRWSQAGVWKAMFEALSDDPAFEFALVDETICLRTAKTLTERDLRDAVIEQTIKQLEQLEHKFHDGDPIREAIAVARRAAATHLVATAPIGGPAPQSPSEPNVPGPGHEVEEV
jgi:putative transposase